jgi:hypothetical protein
MSGGRQAGPMNQGRLAAIATCLMAQMTNLAGHVAALDSHRDPARLEAAATAIVASGDSRAIEKLATRFGQRSFLRRLDTNRVPNALRAHGRACTGDQVCRR